MYNGDRSRKQTLVDFGFRSPPRSTTGAPFEEFNGRVGQVIFVSGHPEYELRESGGAVVEQIIHPRGSSIPRSRSAARTQVDDLLGEIRKNAAAGEGLVTTLTKRMARI